MKSGDKKLAILIKSFVENVIESDKNDKSEIVLDAVISEKEANYIRLQTNLDVNGYSRILDNYSVKHTLKNHGNKTTEIKRGQIPITISDFEKIPEIVKTENIIYGGKNKQGNDVILYHAIIDNAYFYVEEVRKKRKKLVLNSMWKRKIKTG